MAPPEYGIDFIDRGPAAVVQRQDNETNKMAPNPVVQLKTNLVLDQDLMVSPKARIVDLNHSRASVHGAARKRALDMSTWSDIPSQTVCNHSVPYNAIYAGISSQMNGKDLQENASFLAQAYGAFAATADQDKKACEVVGDLYAGKVVKRQELNSAIDYMIYKICDYPKNLFFWPWTTGDAGGTREDLPVNTGATPAGWNPNNATLADLQKETQRLKDAKSYLEEVFG